MPFRNSSPCARAMIGSALAALVLVACGGGGSDNATTSGGGKGGSADAVTKDNALAAKVPSSISSDGKIKVGTDATYAPSEFVDKDGKTVVGFDVDLFNAVAAKLGLKADYTPAPFGNIIPGVQSGKYEIGVSSFTINPDRTKVANMISYFNAGTQWAVKKGNPSGISPDNACGKKVAVQKATVQATDDLPVRQKKCGGNKFRIDQYQAQNQATSSVVSGKDDAMLADSPVVAYAVSQTQGQLETLGDIYDAAPYGYVVAKDQKGFAQAVSAAVDALIKDGTYKKVLAKWGVDGGAVTSSDVKP